MALSWNLTDFIPEKNQQSTVRRPKSKCTISRTISLATAISESNLTVLYLCMCNSLAEIISQTEDPGGGGVLMFALAVALKDPYDPFGIWTVSS